MAVEIWFYLQNLGWPKPGSVSSITPPLNLNLLVLTYLCR